jgi:hypothetical protein
MTAATIDIKANASQAVSEFERLKARASGTLSQMQGEATALQGTLGLLAGSAAAVSFVGMVKGAIDAGDELNKLSQKTGMQVETLSGWRYAAKLADVSNESFNKGIKELNQSIAKGLAGDKEKLANFKALGVTLTDTNGRIKTTEQVLLDVADAYSTAKDGADKVTIGAALMGKASTDMIPLLNAGSDSIRQMKAEAEALGLVISGDFAAQAEALNDNLTRLHTGSQKLGLEIAGEVVPALQAVVMELVNAKTASGETGQSFGTMVGEGVTTAIETVAVLAANVSFVLKGMGREVGAIGAQMVALAHMDLDGFTAISDAVKADGERAAKELDALEKRIQRIKSPDAGGFESGFVGTGALTDPNKKQLKAPGSTTAEQETEYQKLIKTVSERIAQANEELRVGHELSEQEKFAVKTTADMDLAKKQLTVTERAHIKALLDQSNQLDLQQRAERSAQADAKARAEERQRTRAAEYEAGHQLYLQQMEEDHQRMKAAGDMLESIQFETATLQMDNKQREVAIALRDLERQGIKEGTAAYTEYADKIRAAVVNRENIKQAIDEQQQLRDAWKQTADDIYNGLSDSLMRAFEAGKGFWRTLWDGIKNTLKTEALKVIVQGVVGGVSGQGSGVAGSIANSVLGSAGNSLFGSVTGTGGSSLFSGVGSAFMGGFNGAGTATAIGATGDAMGGAAGILGAADSSAASVALDLGVESAATEAATTGIATGLGAGIEAGLAAVPVVGWIALAAMVLYSAFGGKGGGPKTEAGYAPGGMDISGIDIGGSKQGSERGDVASAKAVSESISNAYSTMADALGLVRKTIQVGVFWAMDNADGGTSMTQLQVKTDNYNRSDRLGGIENVARGADALKAAVTAESARALFAELMAQADQVPTMIKDMIKNADSMTDEAVTALLGQVSNIVEGVHGFQDAIEALPFTNLRNLSFDAAAGLIAAAGGLDKLKAGVQAYADNFLSDAEKRTATVQQITGALNAGGVNVSADQVAGAGRAQFRALADSLDVTTESGQRAYAAMMSVAGAFASITDASTIVAETFDQAVARMTKEMNDFRDQQVASAAMAKGRAIQAEIDFLAANTAKAQQGLQEALARQQTSIQADQQAQAAVDQLVDSLMGKVQQMRALSDSLDTGPDSGLSQTQDYEARKRALAGANADNVGDLVKSYLGSAKDHAGTALEYRRAVAEGKAALSAQELLLQAQANAAQETQNMAAGAHNATAALDVFTAQARLAIAQVMEYARGKDYGPDLVQQKVLDIYGQSHMDAATFDAFAQSQLGLTVDVPAFAKGTDYVPHDMLAQIHEGERITPREYNRADSTNAQIASAISAMHSELLPALVQLTINTLQQKKLHDRWDRDGLKIRTDADEPINTVAA